MWSRKRGLAAIFGVLILLGIISNVKKVRIANSHEEDLKRARHFVSETLRDLDKATESMEFTSKNFVRHYLEAVEGGRFDETLATTVRYDKDEANALMEDLLTLHTNLVNEEIQRAVSTLKYLDLLKDTSTNPSISEMRGQIESRIEELEGWKSLSRLLRKASREAVQRIFTEI